MDSYIPIEASRDREEQVPYLVQILEEAREEGDWKTWFDFGNKMLLNDVLGPWGDFCEMRYKALLKREDGGELEALVDNAERICQIIASYANRPFDIEYPCAITKTRTVRVEVPKERRVGLFKKETYIDVEERTETYEEAGFVRYQGWFMERLSLRSSHVIYGDSTVEEVLRVDYCLAPDGKVYTIAYIDGDAAWNPLISECSHFSPLFLSNPSMNVLTQALSGSIGALDYIPIGGLNPETQLRFNAERYEKTYSFNFPMQAETDDRIFDPYTGLVNRVFKANLLDEQARQECVSNYGFLAKFL